MTKDTPEPDPKSMVTPFAFEIAPEILYTPLASPLKRGLAMTIDGYLLPCWLSRQAGYLYYLWY